MIAPQCGGRCRMRISRSPIGWGDGVPNAVTRNTAAVVTPAAEISHLAPHSLDIPKTCCSAQNGSKNRED